MFFIGPSGYIITLMLTAFLPVIMLVVSPMQNLRLGWSSENERLASHSVERQIDRVMESKAFSMDVACDLVADSANEWVPRIRLISGLIYSPKATLCASPVLAGNTNKAPPVV